MIQLEMTMRSVALDMDTKVMMFLPEDRHKTEDKRGKTYPVLYVLHGMKEDNSSWIALSNLFLMCRDLDLIVVMPAVQKSFYTDQVYGLDYLTYITEELPLKLKNYFPITEDVNRTFVMGESMGGYGTLKCALTHPENYGKAVCLSGSNVIDLPFDSFDKLFAGNFGTYEKLKQSNDNLANVIPSFNKAVHKPDIMFYCGTEDFVYPGCKAFYEQLKENCPDANIEAEWWHGEHNFFFWNEAIPKALRYFGFEVRQNSVI